VSDNKARDLILQALGSPATDDAPLALGCVLDSLHAEAEMLQMGENLGQHAELLNIAHATRLKALEEFISDYLTVSWRETAAEAKPKAAE